ncbi:uncharacterized protein LOC114743912 [Neltuma alba]|uniref:uncharacterized protein LOC114717006 n=1 Tax=Neltuma alba TaxID=207710 RepID=UPI0010A2D7EC|nr:uncharacterized protein LOC114717006 [Prosopis alba]XP_028787942.1 uncharacterized protein LOC114743912 [Prosopis alba]XP_028787943.1 uncharacterized protein LOC114743912 [Prosopis alba]
MVSRAVQNSKILILVPAILFFLCYFLGWSGSVVRRNQRSSDLIAQLLALLKDCNEAEFLPGRCDTAAIAALIRQLAQDIRELTSSNPVTIFNGNSSSNGSYASYLLPAAAIGVMGYCYMWWKRKMANAVATVTKQLENVHETLASTRKHLTEKLEVLDLKIEEYNELTQLIANDVNEVKSNLSQIGGDFGRIHEMISGLEGKLKLVESKQDITNSGLWYLCRLADQFTGQPSSRLFKEVSTELADHSTKALVGESSLKGLQFITETTETVEKSVSDTKKGGISFANEKGPISRTRVRRSFPVNISLGEDIMG